MMFSFLYNPGKFLEFADKSYIYLRHAVVYLLSISLVYALLFSPDDYQQGLTVKIMYIHVPSAWLGMFTYLLMTIYCNNNRTILTHIRILSLLTFLSL